MDNLILQDISQFLKQHQDFGFETEQEMVVAALQLLRLQLRTEQTKHLGE